MAETAAPSEPDSVLRSRRFIGLLVLAAAVGLLVSLFAWGFLQLVHQMQVGVFEDLPDTLGYDDGAPLWWYLPVLALAGLLAAAAIERLPGRGGHLPAEGLKTGTTEPVEVPGVVLAALATLGLGLVLGPEAPLIATGSGLAILTIRLARRDAPGQVQAVVEATGAFAALAMIFESPLIAAVILVEAAGIGGPRLPLVLLPGLLGAGIGSLVSIGMGSWTGLSTSEYALPPLTLPQYARPEAADFVWTILLAVAVAVAVFAAFRLAERLAGVVSTRPFLLLPAAGLVVALLAILFHVTTDHGVDQVLFSGESALGPLAADPGAWSLSALALLVVFKGLAYSISLAGFRGGPVFPALFLGAAGGLIAGHVVGFPVTPAVAVGMGAAVASALQLPLAAVVVATLLTGSAGIGASPLIIVGVVVAFLATKLLFGAAAPVPVAAKTASSGAGT